jgi:hypothetical protein
MFSGSGPPLPKQAHAGLQTGNDDIVDSFRVRLSLVDVEIDGCHWRILAAAEVEKQWKKDVD